MNRPLLVVDGDSFAHRSYHALPKSIRRRGNKGGGAIVGFANFLLRLYETERPRAVLVAWDTLDEPTYRHRALADYQGGREFDTELVETFWQAVAANALMNLHLVLHYGGNSHHIAEAIFKGVGRAMGQACALDPRIHGVFSTKGEL